MNEVWLYFQATEEQKALLREFVISEVNNDFTLCIRVNINEYVTAILSLFQHEPCVRFAVFSDTKGKLLDNLDITTDMFKDVLNNLAERYHNALTRKSPVVNKQLFDMWVPVLNSAPTEKLKVTKQTSNLKGLLDMASADGKH